MNNRVILTAASLSLLAACGGGSVEECSFARCDGVAPVGGGGGGGSLMLITRDNAQAALQEAWYAATASAGVPGFLNSTGAGTPDVGQVTVDPNGPTTYNCPTSGTFIVTGSVTDPNTVTAGDLINYESSACDSGTGYIVDGAHTWEVVSVAGDPNSGSYELAQILSFDAFQAQDMNGTTEFTGDHTAVIDTTNAGVAITTFSGSSLSITESSAPITMTGYSGSATVGTGGSSDLLLDVAGNANSSLITGSFNYQTDETFQQAPGAYPFEGILVIMGLNNSQARIAVVDATQLRVEVDENGSQNYEISTLMTWDEFLGI